MGTFPLWEIQKLTEIFLHHRQTENKNEASREIQKILCSESLSLVLSTIWSRRDLLGSNFSQRRENVSSYTQYSNFTEGAGAPQGWLHSFTKQRVKDNKELSKDAPNKGTDLQKLNLVQWNYMTYSAENLKLLS